MTQLHQPSRERLLKSVLVEGEKLIEIFETLIADATLNEEHSTAVVIHWLDTDDEFVAGTYIPEIHFVIRRVDDLIESNDAGDTNESS
jgi:hypothetical protein